VTSAKRTSPPVECTMTTCDLKSVCEFLSAFFAFGAAAFWFYASWISRGSLLSTPLGNLDRIEKLQARCNAIAAACAGLAALLQIAVTRMPVCRAFG
jgi:hypothetical protein